MSAIPPGSRGGNNRLALISNLLFHSSSSHEEQAFVIIIPVGLPPELHQCAPEYFLVVDSGATVHCVWDATCTAHLSPVLSYIVYSISISNSASILDIFISPCILPNLYIFGINCSAVSSTASGKPSFTSSAINTYTFF